MRKFIFKHFTKKKKKKTGGKEGRSERRSQARKLILGWASLGTWQSERW